MKKLNGIRLRHRKNTENVATVHFRVPAKVKIPMSMHMGVPCTPLVKAGDTVKVGQKIGDSYAPFSVPVHSGVSGKVTAINEQPVPVTIPAKTTKATPEIMTSSQPNHFESSTYPVTVHATTIDQHDWPVMTTVNPI